VVEALGHGFLQRDHQGDHRGENDCDAERPGQDVRPVQPDVGGSGLLLDDGDEGSQVSRRLVSPRSPKRAAIRLSSCSTVAPT
jgi:hypothetical protein